MDPLGLIKVAEETEAQQFWQRYQSDFSARESFHGHLSQVIIMLPSLLINQVGSTSNTPTEKKVLKF